MLAKPDYTQGAEIINISAVRGMGDNSRAAQNDYIQKRRQIWAARVPSAVKVIALAILEHMSPENMECYPSRDRLAYMCNMPRNTFERHYQAAKQLFNYADRKGKTTVFSPKILDVAAELARLWPVGGEDRKATRERYKPSPKMGDTQNGVDPKMSVPQNSHTLPQNGGDTLPQNGGTNRSRIDQLEEKEDIQPSDKPRPYSQPFEDFWKQYPRKEGKGKAYAAWKRLNAADRKNADEALAAQLPVLLAKAREERGNFCPHAATWLGQRRFDDEVEQVRGRPEQRKGNGRTSLLEIDRLAFGEME